MPIKDTHNRDASTLMPQTLRVEEVTAMTGLSNMHLWRLEKRGLYPKRFKLNPEGGKNGAVRFDYDEVCAWFEERRRSREDAG